YNNNPALLLALLLGGTGLASLVAAQLQLSGLTVTAVEGEPVPAGQMLLLHLHARADDTRQRRGLQVALGGAAFDRDAAAPVVLELQRGQGEAQLLTRAVQRGWLARPRLRIDTTQPLGLARAWAHVWAQGPLLVHPKPEPDDPPLPEGARENA